MSISNFVLKQSTRRPRVILCYIARPSGRHASANSNPFPYPTHSNPQPHQIFHLSRSATQQQIKERYYDLVRIYHPDSPVARKYPPEIAQARFQSISKAYDLMRGKNPVTGEVLTNRERHVDPARFRPKAPRRRPHFDENTGDERWKERVLFGATVLAIAGFVMQTTTSRHRAVAQVTQGARTTSSELERSLADEALSEPTDSARPQRS